MGELLHTALFGLPPARIGKVREVYDLGDALLIVATDRISAFDVVMANGIPDKGRILNQMSAFWFETLADVCPNHVLSTDDEVIRSRLNQEQPEIAGRATLAKKAEPLPIECVARGYIAGSLFKDYQREGGKVHGLDLPGGLLKSSRLEQPIFTPATKAQEGHDQNIDFSTAADLVGEEIAALARRWTLELYARGAAYCADRGIILADTKFEFGLTDDGLILIDECLTPDSSRFWTVDGYEPGRSQASYDKQFVRDYLESIAWDKQPPGPTLPPEVVERTRAKYLDAYRRIVGTDLPAGP